MMTLDFTFERRLELQREEAIEEGIKIGREAGKIDALCELIRKKMENHKSLEQIATDLDVTVDDIRSLYEQIAKEI